MFQRTVKVPETKIWLDLLDHICNLPPHNRAPDWQYCWLKQMDHFVHIGPQCGLCSRFHCHGPGTVSEHEDMEEEETDSSREEVFWMDMREKMENCLSPSWKTNYYFIVRILLYTLCHHFPHPLKTVCDTHQRIGRLRNSPEKRMYTIHLHQEQNTMQQETCHCPDLHGDVWI